MHRKKKNGQYYGSYCFWLKINGSNRRISTHTKDAKEAHKFKQKYLLDNNLASVPEKAKKKTLAVIKDHISDALEGESCLLKEAWPEYRALYRPSGSGGYKKPSDDQWKRKKSMWDDFVAYMDSEGIALMRGVTKSCAIKYINLLEETGRYDKIVVRSGGNYKYKDGALGSSVVKKFIQTLRSVFNILQEISGVSKNPFESIKSRQGPVGKKDAFERDEIEMISDFIKDGEQLQKSVKESTDVETLRTIWIVGLNTGLRKGDICLLKWSSIMSFGDDEKLALSLETGKGKGRVRVFIPMTTELRNLIFDQNKDDDDGYIFPVLANRYLRDPNKISTVFKAMLNQLGIKNQCESPSGRKVSIKDIHSTRHTFCYIHGVLQTPLVVLQEMVGHLDPQMTRHYMAHSTRYAKELAVGKMSEFYKTLKKAGSVEC